jgi:hypothetical protein
VDLARFQYRATMRSGGGGTFNAQWLFANDSALVLPFPVAFGSSRFSPYEADTPGLGEIWNKNPQLSNVTLAAWLDGSHFCGSQDQWQNGYPVGTPGPVIGPDGVPVCCGVLGAAYDYGFDEGFDS